jgi:hypothetical protein
VLGVLLASVPLAATGAGAGVEVQEVPNNVHFVLSDVASGNTRYICVDGEEVAELKSTAAGAAASADVEVSPGNHTFMADIDDDCTGGTTTVVNLGGGEEYSSVFFLTASQWVIASAVDDSTPTPLGKARFIARHAASGVPSVRVCLDGVVSSNLIAYQNSAVLEFDAAQDLPVGLDIEGVPGDCAPPNAPLGDLDFAAGTTFVANVVNGPAGFTLDARVLVVGQERPTNEADVPEFCTVVNPDLGAFSDGLKELLTEESVTDPDLVSQEDLQALVESGAATIAMGDETVPDTIKPQWEILTAGLRDLIAGLEAAGYDWSVIPEDSREEIVDGLNNPEPDAERDAAREVLTDWYIGNCLAASAPAPAPVEVTPKFTG